MNNNSLNKIKIFDEDLKESIKDFLIKEYSARDLNFSPASPYWQIISVLAELNDLQFFYLEDALNERNIETAFKYKSIFGLSRLTGHNPSRNVSAKGEITLKIKPGASNQIATNNIELLNYTKLYCENNQLTYLLLLNSDSVLIPKTSSSNFKFVVIEGSILSQSFVATGSPLQSYNVSNELIENDLVRVFVNDRLFSVKESIYDISKNENSVIVKTGINGGIDIYFGNEDYGYIPKQGETIRVEYLVSNGLLGNISQPSTTIQFQFVDKINDPFGNEIDFNDIFDIQINKKITLGANKESKELTRFLMNKNSRGLVLANPDNYIHFLSKFNQFSYVYAYNTFDDNYLDDDNVVYLFLLPDIIKKTTSNSDYFTTDIRNFYLDNDEKDAVYDVINMSGRQLISTELKIVDPIIKRYAVNVFIRVYDDIPSNDSIKAEIIDKIGNYFLTIDRRDKIPKSDLIRIIESLNGVDSVAINFISGENEDAIRNGYYYTEINYNNKQNTDILYSQLKNKFDFSTNITTTQKIELGSDVDPNIGLDEFGDIKIGKNELPILRGGFFDRNGVEYVDGLSNNLLCAVNIIIKESIPRKGKYSLK